MWVKHPSCEWANLSLIVLLRHLFGCVCEFFFQFHLFQLNLLLIIYGTFLLAISMPCVMTILRMPMHIAHIERGTLLPSIRCSWCAHNIFAWHITHSILEQANRAIRELLWLMCIEFPTARLLCCAVLCTACVQCWCAPFACHVLT